MTVREATWVSRLSSLVINNESPDYSKLYSYVQECAENEAVAEIVGKDSVDDIVDEELYTSLTGKDTNEPIFDKITGLEIEPKAKQHIKQGLQQERNKQRSSKKANKGSTR